MGGIDAGCILCFGVVGLNEGIGYSSGSVDDLVGLCRYEEGVLPCNNNNGEILFVDWLAGEGMELV